MYIIGKIYHGFKLVEESKIDDIQSLARVFEHEKTGAKLLHLENDDNNKVFSIGFRTPPTDDTGVPHILEHCVLSGSRKYTTKEPFMDMVKSSLQTFINAMTFSDKTLYPVASRNEKDFYNLMDVYLDAVLYPKIYEIPNIFMQEGWHHEIFNVEEKITYKGVVYNEMKGAYSSPERILSENISKSLFPDTCYQYSSGGNPDYIPELTYENFLDFHRKLYHPTNSYIFLYGDGNIDEQLNYIDENYLSNFEKIEIDSHIEEQKTFTEPSKIKDFYNISPDDEEENKTYLSLNFITGYNSNLENYLMNSIISEILVGAESAPVKNALIKEKIGEDIFATSIDGMQSGFGIIAKNTSEEKEEIFKEVIFKTLKNEVESGIDKDLIEASINKVEYDLREASGYPTKGIIYNMLSLDSWLYDGDPISHLNYGETIKKLRDNIKTDYFERYIENYLLNNKHSSIVIIAPKKALAEEKEKDLEKKLDDYKKSLSEEELKVLIESNNKLREMQLSDDTEEAKETIPKLSISDVEPKAEIIPQEVIKEDNMTILFHDIFTSKIAYLDLYFDTSMVEEKYIPYINLLTRLLGKMDTKNRTFGELSNYIYVNTGGIGFDSAAMVEENNSDKFSPKIVVRGKAIGENIVTLMELINELITDTKLEDYHRLEDLLLKMKSRMEMGIFDSGNAVAMGRVSSYFSASSKYLDQLKGLEFYWFISDMIKNFADEKGNIVSDLKEVYGKVFNKNNLVISFTGDEEDFKVVRHNLEKAINGLSEEEISPQKYEFKEEKLNEGILSTANVQYVSKGYNFKKLGYEFDGSLRVLATILNGDYLHNRIRAQGGAYGAGISFDKTGHVVTFSYRDPNLRETISVYDNMSGYVNGMELTDVELTQFIIGTMARLDPALTAPMKGQIATARYISNIGQEEIQQIRDQVLNTELSKIKSFVPLLDETMKAEYLCVLGNENKIKEDEELFNNVVKLMR